jgi:hypothetical protein
MDGDGIYDAALSPLALALSNKHNNNKATM